MWTFDVVSQFIGCLAMIGMLAVAFGATRRMIPGTTLATSILGGLFGAMAVVQMFLPLQLAEGVIVDGRTIPVALAGAFLGLRGLLLCMAIAIATRIGIGGIGWGAGVVSILIAGMAGAAWARSTSGQGRRSLGDLMFFAAMMSAHVLGAMLLPTDIAIKFFREAMPVVLLLNFAAVPAIGSLLEREHRAMRDESREREDRLALSEWGLMPLEEFQRTLGRLIATGAMGSRVGLLTVRLTGGAGSLLWGRQVRAHLVAELTRHLRDTLPSAALVGDIGAGQFAVALPGALDAGATVALLEEQIVGKVVDVPGAANVRLPVRLSLKEFDQLPSSEEISEVVMPRTWFRRRKGTGGPVWGRQTPDAFDEPAASPRLFRIAGHLIAQNLDGRDYGRDG